jgi:lysyl-tRNA synthetase class 2
MSIPEFNEIVEQNDQTEARLESLDKLRGLIGNAYPNKYEREVIRDGEVIIPDQKATITSVVEFAKPIKDKHISPASADEKPSDEQREAANAELNGYRVRVAGRMAVPPRVMGKAAFVHLSDGIERLQIYVRKQDAKAVNNDTGEVIDEEGRAWELFGLLSHGDFIGVEGYLFVTKTGELSIHVETIQFLSKAMLPMPDKMHGIADPEIRRRFRYVDLIASSLRNKTDEEIEEEKRTGVKELTTREVFERRARLISEMRRYLDDNGFIEVETPMLTPKATGAAATPFVTHHNALDITLYARIAPELYLKRLVVGGFEKVYELNRNFRNEGLSQKHNPEFTMLEFYCAYMDVNGMMDFAEAMIKESVQKAAGSLHLKIKHLGILDRTINFADKFMRLTMKAAIIKYLPQCCREFEGERVSSHWLEDLSKIKLLEFALPNIVHSQALRSWEMLEEIAMSTDETRLKYWNELIEVKNLIWEQAKIEAQKPMPLEIDKEKAIAQIIVKLFEETVEDKIINPTFIVDYPKSISPLSKASPENPQIAERFELFINGMEVANGFSELNDPREQYERFADQMRERETGDEEAMILDEDYIRALSYGMPPAAGIGIGIDRLTMLLTNKHSIRDVILFPHMRPEKKDEETRREGEEETEN